MAYTTDLGANPTIIDDSNAHRYVEHLRDTPGLSSGFQSRDYSRHGLGSYAPKFSGSIIPRSKWDDLIKMQEDNQSSPWHAHQRNNVPILDQNGFPYCWMYGTAACMMTRYAMTGIDPVPHLSATYTAALTKNFREVGGWAGEAIEGIDRYGMPTVSTFPEHSRDRSLYKNHEVQLDAKRHGVARFTELPERNFDAMVSVLLDPKNPSPVTMGLMWWGHLVAGLRVVKIDRNSYGVQGPNSWKKTWGDNGCFVLAEKKATAQESVSVRGITPRNEDDHAV